MDLDTALQYVSAGILGIRVSTKHEAKTCVNHAKKTWPEAGFKRYRRRSGHLECLWSVFGRSSDGHLLERWQWFHPNP